MARKLPVGLELDGLPGSNSELLSPQHRHREGDRTHPLLYWSRHALLALLLKDIVCRGGLAQIDFRCPCPPPGMRSQTRQNARMFSGVLIDTRT